jgi:hypothetical protein
VTNEPRITLRRYLGRHERPRFGRGCLAVTFALMWLCGLGCAAATAATWTIQQAANLPARHVDLASVSCTTQTLCTAVGSSFPYGTGPARPLAERWEGTAWTIQRSAAKPANAVLNSVSCGSSAGCIAVGVRNGTGDNYGDTYPLAERWNGTRWSATSVPRPFADGSADDATLYSVSCTSNRACTAVGSDDDAGVPLVERWNGSRWSIQPTTAPSLDGGVLFDVSCTSGRSCTAVGAYTDSNECSTPLVEIWNGSKWAIRPSVVFPECKQENSTDFASVSCVFRTSCTVVGQYDDGTKPYVSTLVERESAGRWSVLPTPALSYVADPWGGGAYFVEVSCATVTACVAVGGAGSEVRSVPVLERWSGVRWKVQTVPGHVTDGALSGISCSSPTACTAVGYNDSPGLGTDEALIVRLS